MNGFEFLDAGGGTIGVPDGGGVIDNWSGQGFICEEDVLLGEAPGGAGKRF